MSEFDHLQERLRNTYQEEVTDVPVERYLRKIEDTGEFSGLDYNGLEDFREHLRRVVVLARWSANEAAEPPAPAVKALHWWLTEDYLDSNWWWTYIGFPEQISPVTALWGNYLEAEYPAVFRKLIAYHDRVYSYSQTTPRGDGANLADMSYYAMVGAIMARNARRMEQLKERGFERAIRLVGREEPLDGWRLDGTMLAHGPQLHNGTYGRELANSASRALVLLHGTRWELERSALELIEGQMLDAVRHMTYGNWFDYNAVGRALSRPPSASLGIGFIGVIQRLLQMDPDHPEELSRLLARIEEDAVTPENYFAGTRAFPVGEFLSHIRRGYYTSVRLVSERTRRNEVLNNEGRRNRYFGDGIQFTLVHGDEYDDLPAVWDYARLPGLTARQAEDLQPPVTAGEPGRANYAGVLAEDGLGIAAMRLDVDSLTGWKSWFFMEEGVVALASDLRNSDPEDRVGVWTTLNQTRASDPVHGGYGNGANIHWTGEGAERVAEKPAWFWHRDIGYLVMAGDGDVEFSVVHRTGDWSDVGTSSGEVQADVFTLGIDHGTHPAGGGYAYMVLPAVSAEDTLAALGDPVVEVLSRSEVVHAVRHRRSGTIFAAFFAAAELHYGEGRVLRADGPSLVLLREVGEETVATVVDPTHARTTGSLRLSRGADETSEDSADWVFDFPDGEFTGFSLTHRFRTRK